MSSHYTCIIMYFNTLLALDMRKWTYIQHKTIFSFFRLKADKPLPEVFFGLAGMFKLRLNAFFFCLQVLTTCLI